MYWLTDPGAGFALAGQLMLPLWLLLAVAVFVRRLAQPVVAVGLYVLPVVFGFWYVALMWPHVPFQQGGFGSLDALRQLFAVDALLLAGWLHFLVFDFFVGCWIVRDARQSSLENWLALPCLPLCFLAGPAGLLAWLCVRGVGALVQRGGVPAP